MLRLPVAMIPKFQCLGPHGAQRYSPISSEEKALSDIPFSEDKSKGARLSQFFSPEMTIVMQFLCQVHNEKSLWCSFWMSVWAGPERHDNLS